MPLQLLPGKDVKKTDMLLIDPSNIAMNAFAVHANSKGEELSAVLKNPKEGTVYIGDFNIDFAKKNLDKDGKVLASELELALKDSGLRVEMSPGAIEELTLLFKMRSPDSMYNQQVLKGGMPSLALKDMAFKLVERKQGEPIIPSALEEKFKELQARNDKMVEGIEALQKNGNFNDVTVNELCEEAAVINYANPESSFFHDHTSVWYYDEATNTVVYAINSIKQTLYDYADHFKDWGSKNDQEKGEFLADANTKYNALEHKAYVEFYQLILKREKLKTQEGKLAEPVPTPENISKYSKEQLQSLIKKSIKGEDNAVGGPLKVEDYKDFFEKVLLSNEFTAVNNLKRTPHIIDDEAIKKLVNENMSKSYARKLETLLSAVFQGLDTKIPTTGDSCTSLMGTGFKAFVKANGELYTEEEMRDTQIEAVKQDLNRLQQKFQTAQFATVIIEAVNNGTIVQPEKVEAITQCTQEINAQNRANYHQYLQQNPVFRATTAQLRNELDQANHRMTDLTDTLNQITIALEQEKGVNHTKSEENAERFKAVSTNLTAMNRSLWETQRAFNELNFASQAINNNLQTANKQIANSYFQLNVLLAAATATISLAALVVATLAVVAIIAIPPLGAGILFGVGALTGIAAVSFFCNRNTAFKLPPCSQLEDVNHPKPIGCTTALPSI